MSVQKFKVKKKPSNFTQIHNSILQKLNNYEALGLYCYIASLPPEWEFHKVHLSSRAGIGRDKLNRLLNLLELHGLIRIEQERGQDGRFSLFNMHVLDEEEFKIVQPSEKVQPFTEKPLTENRLLVNSSYKEDIEKENIKEKENIYCSSDDEPEYFDIFWSIYPKKQKKLDAKKIWVKDELDKNGIMIIDDVKKRCTGEWFNRDKQYIPMASTYLNGERWTDEHIDAEKQKVSPLKEGGDVNRVMEFARNYSNTYQGS